MGILEQITKNVISSKKLRQRAPSGERAARTRERIIEAAGHLFGRLGFRKTTITEVAEKAGISKATVYIYFDDKQDLFSTLVRQSADRVLTRIREAVAGEKSVGDRLRVFILTRIRNMQSLLEYYRADPRLLLDQRSAMLEMVADLAREEQRLLEEILQQGIDEGELALRDPQLAAVAIAGTVRSLDLPWFFQQQPVDLEQSADELVELFMRGMTGGKDKA